MESKQMEKIQLFVFLLVLFHFGCQSYREPTDVERAMESVIQGHLRDFGCPNVAVKVRDDTAIFTGSAPKERIAQCAKAGGGMVMSVSNNIKPSN
jgi:hypothetical protein